MKRKEMLKIIKKVVKPWEDCKFENRLYDEILTAIEKAGMKGPVDENYREFMAKFLGYNNYNEYLDNHGDNLRGGWENEKSRR